MPSLFAPLALIALLASSAYAQFTINTPLSVVGCLPALLTWTGGNPPYFLVSSFLFSWIETVSYFIFSILPANQPSAAALVDLGQQTGQSVTWVANLGAGTAAFLNLRDSTGALAQSGTFTVQTGSNSSCVGQPAQTSAGPAGATPPAGQTNTPTPGSGSTGSSTPKPTASGSGSGSATPPKPTKAASPAVAQYAPVGAAAMIGAALLSLVL